MKVSAKEPAKRTVHVCLSKAEMIVLANYHLRQMKGIPKRLLAAKGTQFVTPSAAKIIVEIAREQVEAHNTRARYLIERLKAAQGGVS